MSSYQVIVERHTKLLAAQPWQINEITVRLLKQLSKAHNPHNKLLPIQQIEILLDVCKKQHLQNEVRSSLDFTLAFNCLRTIIISNFQDIKKSKMYGAVGMLYTQNLNSAFTRFKREKKHEINLTEIIRKYILTEIMLKLVQRTKSFIPEYFRFINLSLESLASKLQNIRKTKFRIERQTNEDNIPQQFYQYAFKRENQPEEREFVILVINKIGNQVQRFARATGSYNTYLSLDIITKIEQKIRTIMDFLKENQKENFFLPFQKQNNTQKKEDQPIYLEEVIQTRELTPRFYDEEESTKVKKLKKKGKQIKKKLEVDLRRSVQNRLQQQQILEDVKKQKTKRRDNKELFILQKQTQEAKKAHKQMSKIKSLKKGKSSKK